MVGIRTADMRYTVTQADASIRASHTWQQIEVANET